MIEPNGNGVPVVGGDELVAITVTVRADQLRQLDLVALTLTGSGRSKGGRSLAVRRLIDQYLGMARDAVEGVSAAS